jgi:hypothetical protein
VPTILKIPPQARERKDHGIIPAISGAKGQKILRWTSLADVALGKESQTRTVSVILSCAKMSYQAA